MLTTWSFPGSSSRGEEGGDDPHEGEHIQGCEADEAFEKTGKPPISTKWVDTDKSHEVGKMNVRSRWVARDFKTRGEKDREDLFCATLPLELFRFLLSRQATCWKDGTMFIDVKKAHLVPECREDVPRRAIRGSGSGVRRVGKLVHWLYGCRRAGQAWEDHYSMCS